MCLCACVCARACGCAVWSCKQSVGLCNLFPIQIGVALWPLVFHGKHRWSRHSWNSWSNDTLIISITVLNVSEYDACSTGPCGDGDCYDVRDNNNPVNFTCDCLELYHEPYCQTGEISIFTTSPARQYPCMANELLRMSCTSCSIVNITQCLMHHPAIPARGLLNCHTCPMPPSWHFWTCLQSTVHQPLLHINRRKELLYIQPTSCAGTHASDSLINFMKKSTNVRVVPVSMVTVQTNWGFIRAPVTRVTMELTAKSTKVGISRCRRSCTGKV